MTIEPTKFYKPTIASLTKAEREMLTVFDGKSIAEYYASEYEFDKPIFDFAFDSGSGFEPDSQPQPLMTRRIAEKTEDHQITYKFSHAVRKNMFASSNGLKAYGAEGWTYRFLYEFLCEVFNGSVPFVDSYFKQLFKIRPVYENFLSIQDDVNNIFYDMPKQDAKGRFIKLPSRAELIKARAKQVGQDIRDDIINCLYTGLLPLRGREGVTVSEKTKKLRKQFPQMHPDRLFYASGSLIKHLNVIVEVAAA